MRRASRIGWCCRATPPRSCAGRSCTATRPTAAPPSWPPPRRRSPRWPRRSPTSSTGPATSGVFQPTSPFRSAPTIRARGRALSRQRAPTRWPPACASRTSSGSTSPTTSPEPGRCSTSASTASTPTTACCGRPGAIQLVRGAALRERAPDRHRPPRAVRGAADEGLDIDTNDDLIAARSRMARAGTVVFRLCANQRVGSGHLHHCLQLADELADQRLRFLLRDCDAVRRRAARRSTATRRARRPTWRATSRRWPGRGANLVVNDVLDTSEEEVLIAAGRRLPRGQHRGPGPGGAVRRLGGERALPAGQRRRGQRRVGPRVRDPAQRVPRPAAEGDPRAPPSAS